MPVRRKSGQEMCYIRAAFQRPEHFIDAMRGDGRVEVLNVCNPKERLALVRKEGGPNTASWAVAMDDIGEPEWLKQRFIDLPLNLPEKPVRCINGAMCGRVLFRESSTCAVLDGVELGERFENVEWHPKHQRHVFHASQL